MNAMRNDMNYTRTENGALTHRESLSTLVDMFYHVPAKRGQVADVQRLFANAYGDNKALATVLAFYVRDIRGGQGERDSFRVILRYLAKHDLNLFNRIMPLVPEYGRWDDLIEYVDNANVVEFVKTQLVADMEAKGSISLLGKWMPSINTSSKKTRQLAMKWVVALGLTVREYRKLLVALRAKLLVVEVAMSANDFSSINYAAVPSRAAYIYRKAFGKRDTERYSAFMTKVEKGEEKINAATLYPHEIVYKLLGYVATEDRTLEALWNALPNYATSEQPALVMADVSGSMSSEVYGSKASALSVSIALALYFAERTKGKFNGYFMTFSEKPDLVKVKGNTLKEKIDNVNRANWNMSTNIEAAFTKILDTAVSAKIPESEMPRILFIVSDMEFNSASTGRTNYKNIQAKYRAAGYEMPKIVFWNVASRKEQVPVTKDEIGTMLVGGLSPSIFKSVMEAKAVTPEDMMLEVINSDRYTRVREVVWSEVYNRKI